MMQRIKPMCAFGCRYNYKDAISKLPIRKEKFMTKVGKYQYIFVIHSFDFDSSSVMILEKKINTFGKLSSYNERLAGDHFF